MEHSACASREQRRSLVSDPVEILCCVFAISRLTQHCMVGGVNRACSFQLHFSKVCSAKDGPCVGFVTFFQQSCANLGTWLARISRVRFQKAFLPLLQGGDDRRPHAITSNNLISGGKRRGGRRRRYEPTGVSIGLHSLELLKLRTSESLLPLQCLFCCVDAHPREARDQGYSLSLFEKLVYAQEGIRGKVRELPWTWTGALTATKRKTHFRILHLARTLLLRRGSHCHFLEALILLIRMASVVGH